MKPSQFVLCAFLAVSPVVSCFGASWLPISDEDRATMECSFDPDAGAEVLYKSIKMDGSHPTASFREYYLRIKIYDQRGAESVGKFRMYYHTGSSRLGRHAARVIKPDGSVREIEKSEFYSEKIQSDGSDSFRARVFSFPTLEPGDIVDLKYRIDLHEYYYTPELLVEFQEAWPLRKADISVRPANWVEQYSHIKWMTSKCDARRMVHKSDGFYEISVENFPAHIDEPHQPPKERQVAWLLFYMTHDGKTGDDYWKQEGSRLFKQMTRLTKPGKNVKDAVKAATANSNDDANNLRGIYEYCIRELTNSAHGEAGRLSPHDREEIKEDMPAEKILEQGFGSPRNINTVFCAMAREAGFDARLTALNRRTSYGFSKVLASMDTTMKGRCIAVKFDDSWRYFDPGGRYLAFGQLDWDEQSVVALIADRKKMELHVVRKDPADRSRNKSVAEVELSEKGRLWGTLRFEFSGLFDVSMKRTLDGMSDESRKEVIAEILHDRWPNVTISSISMTDPSNPFAPLTVECDASWTDYADVVGSRIFFNINIFQVAEKPEFAESKRVSDIFFKFPKVEIDEVAMKLPDGYELEEASAPQPFDVADVFEYTPKLSLHKKSNTLAYSRTLTVHGSQFPVKHYASIKGLFDEKHRQDQHSIALKKSAIDLSSL